MKFAFLFLSLAITSSAFAVNAVVVCEVSGAHLTHTAVYEIGDFSVQDCLNLARKKTSEIGPVNVSFEQYTDYQGQQEGSKGHVLSTSIKDAGQVPAKLEYKELN